MEKKPKKSSNRKSLKPACEKFSKPLEKVVSDAYVPKASTEVSEEKSTQNTPVNLSRPVIPPISPVNSGPIIPSDLEALDENMLHSIFEPYGMRQRISNYAKQTFERYHNKVLDLGVAFLLGGIVTAYYLGFPVKTRESTKTKVSQGNSVTTTLDTSNSEDDISEAIDTTDATLSDISLKKKTTYVPIKRAISSSEVLDIVKKSKKLNIQMGGAGPLIAMLGSYGNHPCLNKGDTLELKGKDLAKSLASELDTSKDNSKDMDSLRSILIYKSENYRSTKDSCNFIIRINSGKYEIPATLGCGAIINGKISGIAKYCFKHNNYAVLYLDSGSCGRVMIKPSFFVKKLTSVSNLKLTMMELFKRKKEYVGRVWGIPLDGTSSLVVLENNLSNPGPSNINYKTDLHKDYAFYYETKRSYPKDSVDILK